ncbi:MAG: HIT domain-containing protein [Tatlockia sp.]|nr:HIT domain-containing protein [Tatlockia sp.]
MVFKVDERIENSCIYITNSELSSLYFKKDASYPWLILVPRIVDITEIYQLAAAERQILIEEIALFSQMMKEYFNPHKLNIGALGNVVSQLHIHIVARFKEDKAWPHSIWQPDFAAEVYEPETLDRHIAAMRRIISDIQARSAD